MDISPPNKNWDWLSSIKNQDPALQKQRTWLETSALEQFTLSHLIYILFSQIATKATKVCEDKLCGAYGWRDTDAITEIWAIR